MQGRRVETPFSRLHDFDQNEADGDEFSSSDCRQPCFIEAAFCSGGRLLFIRSAPQTPQGLKLFLAAVLLRNCPGQSSLKEAKTLGDEEGVFLLCSIEVGLQKFLEG